MKIIRCFTGSQWSSLRTGVIRSYLRVQELQLQHFISAYTLPNKYCGSSANNELKLSSLDVTWAWTKVSVSFWVRHFLILDKLRMWKKATLQIFWSWCSWFITSLNITSMFLADSVGTTRTPAILMLHVGGRGRCLAYITKNSVLSRLSLSYYTLHVWSRGKQLVLFSRES